MGHIKVCWNTPYEGWVKLNIDGAAHFDSNLAGYGGLVRDENGRWIIGFAKPPDSCSTFIVECWGALCRLHEAWKMGYRRVQLECDSKSLIQCILNGS